MNELISYTITFLVVAALSAFRARSIVTAINDWNYYVYRYSIHYDKIHNSAEGRTTEIIMKMNEATAIDFFVVFLQIWQLNPDKFFTHKPDYKEIHELYYTR